MVQPHSWHNPTCGTTPPMAQPHSLPPVLHTSIRVELGNRLTGHWVEPVASRRSRLGNRLAGHWVELVGRGRGLCLCLCLYLRHAQLRRATSHATGRATGHVGRWNRSKAIQFRWCRVKCALRTADLVLCGVVSEIWARWHFRMVECVSEKLALGALWAAARATTVFCVAAKTARTTHTHTQSLAVW